MDKETTAILEKLLERKLENEEKERLQRIQDTLRIGPNDALWAIIAAMEYPRIYYEEIPEKIRAVTAGIFEDIAEASEKEVALAQSRLAESVVKRAEKSVPKISYPCMDDMGSRRIFFTAALRKFSCCGSDSGSVRGRCSSPPCYGCLRESFWPQSASAAASFRECSPQKNSPKKIGAGVNFCWRQSPASRREDVSSH